MTTRFHFLVFLFKVLNNQDRCSDGSEYLEKDDRSGNNDEVGMMHLNVDQDLTSKDCFLKVEDEEDGDAKTTLHPILSIKNNSHISVSENIYQDTFNFESFVIFHLQITYCQIVFLYFTKYLIIAECIGFFSTQF